MGAATLFCAPAAIRESRSCAIRRPWPAFAANPHAASDELRSGESAHGERREYNVEAGTGSQAVRWGARQRGRRLPERWNIEPIGFKGEPMRYYIALAHNDPGRGFAITLPDFPGWFARVRRFDEVRAAAGEGIAALIEEMASCGEAIPEPSSFDDLLAHPSPRDCKALLVATRTIANRRLPLSASGNRFREISYDGWPEASA
jgi:predicted RNase H-like HicB family nuclease